MKKISLFAVATLLLIGLLSAQGNNLVNPNAPVGPQTDSNPKLAPRPGVVENMDMLKELNLSEAQKTKLGDLRLAHQKEMNLLDAEIENMRLDMMQAIKKEDFANAKKITQLMFDKKLRKANARLDHMQAMLKELNADQRMKMREMMPGMMMHGKRGMGRDCMKGDCMGQDCMQGQGMGMKHNKGEKDCGNCEDHGNKPMPGKEKPKTEIPK